MYGTPVFITIEERKQVYNTDFSFDPALEKQRDVFVFQSLVGCRIYKDLPGDAILPLISQQKYNVAIKKILQHAGITRSVVWLNPTTGEPEVRPIYEVMSSHSARRAFSGNMYDKIQDPNLICALTGHKEGSKSFARYRKIDEDTNRKTISLLE